MIIILQVVMCGKPRNMKELKSRNDRQIEGIKKPNEFKYMAMSFDVI